MVGPIVAPRTISALCAVFALSALPLHSAGAASSPETSPEAIPLTGKIVTPDLSARPATDPATGSAGKPIYGPILSRDPLVRAQIKRLYIEQRDLVETMRGELLELSQALRAQPDPDFRAEINRDIAAVKKAFQLRHMEIGLDIARLNEDERRVAEFERALDQVRHPEKYRPERPASSVRVERSRR